MTTGEFLKIVNPAGFDHINRSELTTDQDAAILTVLPLLRGCSIGQALYLLNVMLHMVDRHDLTTLRPPVPGVETTDRLQQELDSVDFEKYIPFPGGVQ